MLHTTQKLLFRSIPFHAFKINQPLPLNPRESKQLLDILTNSFRRHLDQEHGTFRSWTDEQIQPAPTPSKSRRKSQSEEVRPSTDRLIQSILVNPLLSNGPKKMQFRTARDPLEIFDDACAKGFMKLEYATACLKAKKRLIVESAVPSVRQGMKESGLGLKVLQWLSSSGMLDNGTFLEDRAFTSTLVEFLVAEELQEVIWVRTEKLMESYGEHNRNHDGWVPADSEYRNVPRLIYSLVRAEVKGSGSLSSAFAVVERAKEMVRKLKCPEVFSLVPACNFLVREHTSTRVSDYSPPSVEGYESFIRLISEWDCPLVTARLWLDHPTKPDASFALKILQHINKPHLGGTSGDKRFSRSGFVDDVILLGVDTARYLLDRGQHSDAQWIIAVLQGNYSRELGVDQKKAVEQAKAEAASIELLENLQLA